MTKRFFVFAALSFALALPAAAQCANQAQYENLRGVRGLRLLVMGGRSLPPSQRVELDRAVMLFLGRLNTAGLVMWQLPGTPPPTATGLHPATIANAILDVSVNDGSTLLTEDDLVHVKLYVQETGVVRDMVLPVVTWTRARAFHGGPSGRGLEITTGWLGAQLVESFACSR